MPATLRKPDDLVAGGFFIDDPETLVGTRRHRELERYLTKLASRIPEMVDGCAVTLKGHTKQCAPMAPRPYQIRYGAMGAMRPANIFGHEAGAGKTLMSILAIYGVYGHRLFEAGRLRKGLIQIASTPLSLELTWLTELTRCGLGAYAQVIHDEESLRKATAPILIYAHDFLKLQTKRGNRWRRQGRRRHRQEKGKWKSTFVGEWMFKLVRKLCPPRFLIIDEIHYFDEGTDRTVAMLELRKCARRCIGLTGTPLDGWLGRLGTAFRIVYGENQPWFPHTLAGFKRTFTQAQMTSADYVTGDDVGKTRRIIAPGVPQHLLPKFYDTVNHLMHRLLFEDDEVSPFVVFPEADYQVIKVPMADAHRDAYDTVYRAVRAELESAVQLLRAGKISRMKAKTTVLPMLMLLRQVATHPWELPAVFAELQQDDSLKLQALRSLLLDFKAQGRKGVVFTHFVPSGRKIAEMCGDAGIKVHRVYANDPEARPQILSLARRTETVLEFLQDDSDVLDASMRLTAESLTLSEVASYVIHFEHGWEAVRFEQSNKRVVRPGQRYDNVPVLSLVTDGTIEWYVYQHMMRKLKANQRTVDRKFSEATEEVGDTLAVLEQLLGGQLQVA